MIINECNILCLIGFKPSQFLCCLKSKRWTCECPGIRPHIDSSSKAGLTRDGNGSNGPNGHMGRWLLTHGPSHFKDCRFGHNFPVNHDSYIRQNFGDYFIFIFMIFFVNFQDLFTPSKVFFTFIVGHLIFFEILAYLTFYYFGTGWLPYLVSVIFYTIVQVWLTLVCQVSR